tara:strand:- start:77 stop:391 length:315 start_codon:yes stop_codon:yes gene_type:complete
MAKRTIKQNFFGAAVINLVGDCIFDTDGKTILNWKSPDKTQPSQSAIEAKMVELQEEWDSQEYARKRKVEYDALNQFELITDDAINGTTTHIDAIKAIKKKYPK